MIELFLLIIAMSLWGVSRSIQKLTNKLAEIYNHNYDRMIEKERLDDD